MKKHNSENIFEHIAQTYSESVGGELQNELKSLPPHYTPRLDQLTAKRIRSLKRRKYTRIAGIAAACLVFVLLIPAVYRLQNLKSYDTSENLSESAQTDDSESTLIPLSFSPPENFSISDTGEDNGVSIYYLADIRQDDVVMQLEYTTTAEPLFDSLKPVTISGNQAYGISTADYKMLTFVHDNILYTLTCQYDFNTLVLLSKNIF